MPMLHVQPRDALARAARDREMHQPPMFPGRQVAAHTWTQCVNYYERYLGGYAKKTGHLELAGHGAYTLMLDTYYSTERPLPADYASLYRICRAIAKSEQEVVRKVADEFFPAGADGLRHNERADAEIAKAQKRIDAAKVNGKGGGRPPKINPPDNPPGYVPDNPPGAETETQQEPGGPHMVKPPDPRPHALTQKVQSEVGLTPDPGPKASNGRAENDAAKRVLECLNRNAGRKYEPVDANLKPILARMHEGYGERDLCAIATVKSRQWKGNEKMEPYIRPKTLFNATNAANYRAELPANKLEATEK